MCIVIIWNDMKRNENNKNKQSMEKLKWNNEKKSIKYEKRISWNFMRVGCFAVKFFFHKWIEMSALHHLIVYKYIHGNMDVICIFYKLQTKIK